MDYDYFTNLTLCTMYDVVILLLQHPTCTDPAY